MVKRYFKGQVKISDVQEAFDEIVNATNAIVSIYNSSKAIEDIDYTKGSAVLAPSGYTLTVGGLKQALALADGCVVGAKPILLSKQQIKMTTGILISDAGVYRLPDAILDKPSGSRSKLTLYYDIFNKTYTWANLGEEKTPRICDVDFNSSSKIASILNNCQNEDIVGTMKITSQSRWVKPVAENSPTDNSIDTSNNPLFVAAIEQIGLEGNPTTTTRLFGNEVSYTRPLHHRDLDTWTPINFLFVPRGVSNPYSVTPANRDFTHKFGVIVDKNIKE